MPAPGQFSATIANGATTSAAINLGIVTLCGIFLPAAFTGVAMTFLASTTVGGTYVPVKDIGGAAYSVTVAQGVYVPVNPNVFLGVRFLKIVSGSAEGAARTVTLVTRNM